MDNEKRLTRNRAAFYRKLNNLGLPIDEIATPKEVFAQITNLSLKRPFSRETELQAIIGELNGTLDDGSWRSLGVSKIFIQENWQDFLQLRLSGLSREEVGATLGYTGSLDRLGEIEAKILNRIRSFIKLRNRYQGDGTNLT